MSKTSPDKTKTLDSLRSSPSVRSASPVRVLVVDDSSFFRRRITQMLEADGRLQVIGTAADGREAIQKVRDLKPDVVTMDIEMPVMDGITAVRRIMAVQPLPILMFSSLSYEGAQATLDALEAGAVDFLPKRFDDISKDKEQSARILRSRVRVLGAQGLQAKSARKKATTDQSGQDVDIAVPARKDLRAIILGSSTGGPLALQKVMVHLPDSFDLPVFIVQHMPASFTPAFAARLDQHCAIHVKEAEDGELVRPGTAYLAPGGRQMAVQQAGAKLCIHIFDGDAKMHFRPCVDVTMTSIAQTYSGKALGVILTGMGTDGREGARELKHRGGTIWAQDEASSVIYGMPMAVAEAGLADHVLGLDAVGPALGRIAK